MAILRAPDWSQRLQKILLEAAPILRPLSLLALFLLAYVFVLRPMQKQVLATAPAASTPAELAGCTARRTADNRFARANFRQSKITKLREETVELIKDKPTNTTRAVQAWLREESF